MVLPLVAYRDRIFAFVNDFCSTDFLECAHFHPLLPNKIIPSFISDTPFYLQANVLVQRNSIRRPAWIKQFVICAANETKHNFVVASIRKVTMLPELKVSCENEEEFFASFICCSHGR